MSLSARRHAQYRLLRARKGMPSWSFPFFVSLSASAANSRPPQERQLQRAQDTEGSPLTRGAVACTVDRVRPQFGLSRPMPVLSRSGLP